MATLLQLPILILMFSFLMSTAIANILFEEASASTSAPQHSRPSQLFQPNKDDQFYGASVFGPVLHSLGFQELAMAVHSLSASSSFNTWTGPSTVFAPTDASIRSCSSCSVTRLLQEHTVPGIFSLHYLQTLAFGTKIETMVPGRCLTVTSAVNNTKIFIGGVEITQPDLFNNGLIVVHGLDGFVSHLSPFSCNIERVNSVSFPFQPSDRSHSVPSFAIMRLMLRDAMVRLRMNGFSILALALRLKYPELVSLQNMTVFTLDDASIFTGGQAYVSNVRFHIVPNRLLLAADLQKLPVATLLPTLEPDQKLKVTTAGGGAMPIRINYVRIKKPDVMHNLKIVVHDLYMPFPHLHQAEAVVDGIGPLGLDGAEMEIPVNKSCSVAGTDGSGSCAVVPNSEIKPTAELRMEDHHGLWCATSKAPGCSNVRSSVTEPYKVTVLLRSLAQVIIN